MKEGIVVISAILMLAIGGLVEFVRSGKSASAEAVQQARARLKAIPLQVGEWVGQEESFDEKQLEVAEAAASTCRDYVNQRTKEQVTLLIIAGNPKAIGAHDPTVCYGGAGFKQKAQEKMMPVTSIDDQAHNFWGTRFDKETFPVQSIYVNWAWTVDGVWAAASNPRIEYATAPLLYKIYVSRGLGPKSSDDRDPSSELLKLLLPEIRKGF